jgi:glucose/arabinose dehydrogenase
VPIAVPLELQLEFVADGFTAPVFLTSPEGDTRQFVVERNGRIRVIANGTLLPLPFLDITARVNFLEERGMLGMAFDPDYASNGRFFVYYVDLAGGVVIERFSSMPGSNFAGASDGIVISIPHGGSEHHGGTIAFGPDGMLYLGPGDGRCCGDPDDNAQDVGSLLGKILRIDVRTFPYAIPPDNPFAGQSSGQEIWAYGLRNPWRFSFDEDTEQLYIGDVGQDSREEVNVVSSHTAPLNFGWPFMEGTACFRPATNCTAGATFTMPAHEYTHVNGCSVTGGFVYRGAAIPELDGHYLYADYCAGWLRSFRVVGTAVTEHRLWSGVALPGALSFGRDGQGELYMIAGARVWRIARQ